METILPVAAISDPPATEPYLKKIDVAFQELRRVLLKAGAEPLAFYQRWAI